MIPTTQRNGSLIVGWRLQERHVLIIGGNHIAANRIEFALDARPHKITLITSHTNISSDKVKEHIEKKNVIHKNREFEASDLFESNNSPVDLVLSAVDNPQLSEKIAIAARELRIPVNIAEIPHLCDFWFMPTYRDEHLQVAISTSGTGPQIAHKIRQHIIESLPQNITTAIDNLALLKQSLGGSNISVLSKITDTLPLNQIAQLSNDDIKKLISEHIRNVDDEETEVSSNSSNDEKKSDVTFVDERQNNSTTLKSKLINENGDDIISPFTSGGIQLVDGKTAVEHIAYAFSTTSFIYPTTRTHYIGEAAFNWASQSVRNAYGQLSQVIKMDTRYGASTAILGTTSATLDRVSIFTTSQSIVSMIPNFYGIVQGKIPLVIHVSALGNDDQMNNYVNYNDALTARETGFGIINSYSSQEIHDIALITHLVSISTKTPFLHVFDGLRTAFEYSKVELLPYNEISKLSDKLVKNFSTESSVVDYIEIVADKVGQLTGRKYHAFEYIGDQNAESILFVLGGETVIAKETLKKISGAERKVGVIIARVYRPWSEKHFLAAVPKTIKRIAILEQVASKEDYSYGSSIFSDVAVSFSSNLWKGTCPTLIDAKYPTTQKFSPRVIHQLLKRLEANEDIIFNEELLPGNVDSLNINNVKQCLFWDLESKETVQTVKHISKILGQHSRFNLSTFSTFDIYNNGSVVTTNLQLGNEVISGFQDIESSYDFISIHDVSLTSKYNILASAKNGAFIVLNTTWTVDELETKLPNDFRYEASKKNIKLYILNTEKIAQNVGLNLDVATNVILQSTFLKLINREVKLDCTLEDSIIDLYEGNSEKEVSLLIRNICQQTEKSIISVELPPTWGILEKSDQNLPLTIQSNSLDRNLDNPEIEKPKLQSWHAVARNLLFKEAFDSNQITRPDLSEKTYTIRVSENRRLTPISYDRYLFHIEFDTTGTNLKYDLGEALGVYGHNDSEEVNKFLEFYGLNPNDIILLPNKGDRLESRTIFQIFAQVLDIFGRPAKRFYDSLAQYATNEKEREKLLWIASNEGSQEFKRRVEDTITYAEILYEFSSAHPPIEDLVQLIAPIKPRHYSIASAQSVHPNSVHLLVVTVEWENSRSVKRFGQCTRYLSGLKVGENVIVSIKPSVMKLPPRDTQPVIMAGLGTGMAPFRAFIEERAYRKSQGKEVGPMILYFGSRNRSMEYLYGEELEAYHTEGLLSHLRLAFSRDQKHKVYIQHKMQEDSELLNQYLLKDEGWFYLCGPTWPVPDVKDAIVNSFVTSGGLSSSQANDMVNKLKDLERYILEVY
ncbi:7756_t:CDS:1 [Funneliformis caledonium]|uniref:7756_t:CDS:1 n=1 Tax=Funneliformis caledonium TaxID=1117310 RepID=A0A9N9AJB5_9GLOM|nr:7756_t:CDS:1 [Funneliformis caledonium]